MANLLGNSHPSIRPFRPLFTSLAEVSKGDEIMPAIKTLKLLAHPDSNYRSSKSTRLSSSNLAKSTYDDDPAAPPPRSLHTLSSKLDTERADSLVKADDESEAAARHEDSH